MASAPKNRRGFYSGRIRHFWWRQHPKIDEDSIWGGFVTFDGISKRLILWDLCVGSFTQKHSRRDTGGRMTSAQVELMKTARDGINKVFTPTEKKTKASNDKGQGKKLQPPVKKARVKKETTAMRWVKTACPDQLDGCKVYHAELKPVASILPSDSMLSDEEMLTVIHDPSQPSETPAPPPSPAPQPSAAPPIFSFTEKRERVVSQLVFMMCATVLDTLRRACVEYAREKCPACQGVQSSHTSCTLPVVSVWEEARTAVLERVNVLRAVAEWEIWFRGLFNLDAHAVFHLFQVPSPRDVLRRLTGQGHGPDLRGGLVLPLVTPPGQGYGPEMLEQDANPHMVDVMTKLPSLLKGWHTLQEPYGGARPMKCYEVMFDHDFVPFVNQQLEMHKKCEEFVKALPWVTISFHLWTNSLKCARSVKSL